MVEDFCRKQNSLYTIAHSRIAHLEKCGNLINPPNKVHWDSHGQERSNCAASRLCSFNKSGKYYIYNYSIHTFPEAGTIILPISDWNKQGWIFSKQAGAKRRKLNRQPRCPNYKLSGHESATCCSAWRSDRSGVPARKYNGKWTGLEPICRADHTVCLRLPRKIG